MTPGWPSLVFWGAALAAWGWLWHGSRGRARLLDRLSTRHGGFVRSGFSWITLMPEPREVTFVVVVNAAPCRCRVGFLLPPRATVPATVLEIELPEARLGSEEGFYGAEDLATGRGLFLGGANVTTVWRRFLGELPPGVRARLRWRGTVLRLALPALLGDTEEIWVNRAVAFLVEAAELILPPAALPRARP